MRTICTYLGKAGHRAVVLVTVPDEQHLRLVFDVPASGDVGDDIVIVDEQLATLADACAVATDWACEHAIDETHVELLHRGNRVTGEPHELRRYRISSGERKLVGQRILGKVCVSDVPVDAVGHVYLVHHGVNSQRELHALLEDYIAESRRLDAPARKLPAALVDDLAHALAA